MQFQYAVRSKTGLKRDNNEDSYRIDLRDRQPPTLNESSILFVVADGMGGHPCGEVASQMACEVLIDFFNTRREKYGVTLESVLVNIFHFIDDEIRRHTTNNPHCLHMGTTLSVIVIWDENAVIAHVGDTRIYCMRDGTLKLLTTDHTFVQEMLDHGVFTTEMAEASPHRNILTQVLGTDEHLEDVFVQNLEITSGDRILLSTDGLHDTVSFQDIESIMKDGRDPKETAERLLSQAIAKGGQDDITLIVDI